MDMRDEYSEHRNNVYEREDFIMKKNMRIISLLLTVAMCVALTACGKGGASDEDAYKDIIAGLQSGQGYAIVNVETAEHPILLVASGTYDFDGTMVAIDSEVYGYNKDGEIMKYADFISAGTAYPICITDNKYFMYGSGHHMCEVYIDEQNGAVVTKLDESVEYDTDGNATYYEFDLDNEFEGQVEDETKFEAIFDVYNNNAEWIKYTVVE